MSYVVDVQREQLMSQHGIWTSEENTIIHTWLPKHCRQQTPQDTHGYRNHSGAPNGGQERPEREDIVVLRPTLEDARISVCLARALCRRDIVLVVARAIVLVVALALVFDRVRRIDELDSWVIVC